MGYEFHITRTDDWADSEKQPISLEEWLAYVRSDPEMRLEGFAETTNSQGETIRVESKGLAVWTAYSKHGVDGNMAWMDHSAGRITVKNADEEIRQKMYDISGRFGARVQGDNGEHYDDEGNQFADEAVNVPPQATPSRQGGSIWSRLRGALGSGGQTMSASFKIGDRVKDPSRCLATIIGIESSTGALGRVDVKYDDGREASYPLIGCGLKLVDESGKR